MRDGYLDDYDIEALGRQAVDLLDPSARIHVEALISGRAGNPRWGGMAVTQREPRRLVVTISEDSRATLGVDPQWNRAEALANLIEDLAQACGERFRGLPFPPCIDHDHRSRVSIVGADVLLLCPSKGLTAARLTPETPA